MVITVGVNGNQSYTTTLYPLDKYLVMYYDISRYIGCLYTTEAADMFNRHHRPRDFTRPRPERPFQRGVIKYIILNHLKDGSSYGYEIIRALEERFHGFYVPSPGTVYPTLQMLEEMGCVTATEQDDKRVYTITDEGRQLLAEQGEFEEKLKTRMRSWWNPENIDEIGETMREFERLAQLLSIKARTADTEKLSRIRKVISQAYEEISKD
jgi:DNA-binding PadR family transcriptional regulator